MNEFMQQNFKAVGMDIDFDVVEWGTMLVAIRNGLFATVAPAFFAVGDRPVLAKAATKLVGVAVTPALLSDARAALGDELDPHDDQQASASMRRHLAKVLLVRCVSALLGRADLNAGGSA